MIDVEGTFSVAELADERLLARRLAAQKPYWRPGSAYRYHATLIGALTGEVVLRVTGRSIQEIFEERVRTPHGLDLYLGLPEKLEPRYEPIRPMRPTPEQAAQSASAPTDPASLLPIALNLLSADGPALVGGVGNARALAGMYQAVIHGLDGHPALPAADRIAEFTRPHLTGVDLVTGGAAPENRGCSRPWSRRRATRAPKPGERARVRCFGRYRRGVQSIARPRVLVIGLDPYRVPGPWDPEPAARAVEAGLAEFAEHGVGVAACLIGLDGSDDVDTLVGDALRAHPWECVTVGGGRAPLGRPGRAPRACH